MISPFPSAQSYCSCQQKKSRVPSVFRHHHWRNTLLAWHAYRQPQLHNTAAATLTCHVGFANGSGETHCACHKVPPAVLAKIYGFVSVLFKGYRFWWLKCLLFLLIFCERN
ncbi:hypothetical protein AAZX31_12G128600 [Glycine max]